MSFGSSSRYRLPCGGSMKDDIPETKKSPRLCLGVGAKTIVQDKLIWNLADYKSDWTVAMAENAFRIYTRCSSSFIRDAGFWRVFHRR